MDIFVMLCKLFVLFFMNAAMEFGLTDTLNIKSFDKPIEQVRKGGGG